jgi:hypothetical protein
MKGARAGVVTVAVACSLLGAGGARAADSAAVQQAKGLFKRYLDLERAYDVAVAALYADDAVIKHKRIYPTGQIRELAIPAPKYKELIRQGMPLAKARGDRSTYSDCKYEETGQDVRITCSRYSELKKYASPLTLVVGPRRGAEWVILQELSESQP